MAVRLIKPFELDDYIDDATPNRPTLVYVFEEGLPVHPDLKTVFTQIARRASLNNAQSVMINSELVTQEFMEKHHISTFPAFLVYKGPSVPPARFEVSTKERLILNMQKAGIVKEDESCE
jgi:hypothetical protein